eukprot:15437820-Alexandrium_andersonii.AAC.1
MGVWCAGAFRSPSKVGVMRILALSPLLPLASPGESSGPTLEPIDSFCRGSPPCLLPRVPPPHA